MKKIFLSRGGQIWVETVIYTIIGLAIIGIVLAVATPAINKYKDRIVIEQTITTLNNLNEKILEVRDEGLGNRRVAELSIKKGSLTIDSPEEKVFYVLEESSLEYSEAGENVSYGSIKIKTEKKGRKYAITLGLVYDNINMSYNGKDEKRTFNSASTPYKLFIENNGASDGKVKIDIQESS